MLAGVRARRKAAAAACALGLLAAPVLAACGDTLQTEPIAHNTLETLLVAPYPVYWLGRSFERLQITEATHDPGGAFSVQYGNCSEGGQGTCVPPLRVVTSPDNSFLPIGDTARRGAQVRGVGAVLARAGKVIAIPTAGVVVSIYALDARLAARAAQAMVPINEVGSPGAPLPRRRPDTGFGRRPLRSQIPSPQHPPPDTRLGG